MEANRPAMEILVILAVIVGPFAAALVDYVRDTRREARSQQEFQQFIMSLLAEYRREPVDNRNCQEQLRAANGVIDRLLSLLTVQAGGVKIHESAVSIAGDLVGRDKA